MSTKKASDDYDTYRLNGDTYRRRKCRFYTDDFKARIVELYNAGKPPSELLREYQLTSSVLYKWIRQYKTSGSFRTKDSLSQSEKEIIDLKRQIQNLQMENDILKKAALILGKHQRQ